MKKVFAVLYTAILIFSLTSCANEEELISVQTLSSNSNYSTTSNNESTHEQTGHVHNFSPATCTAAAKCSCGATNGTALGHKYSGQSCSRCGARNPSYSGGTSSTHVHNYSSQVISEATCGKEGVRKYTCSCGHSYTEKISKSAFHDWKSATCTQPMTCKVCGKTSGTANGHTYYSSGKCSCGAINPIVSQTLAKCSLTIPSLPKSVSYYGYGNSIRSTVSVTDITYEFECDNDGRISLTLYFSGKKTYDYRGSNQSDSCSVGWKLYGPDGSVIESDTFHSPSIAMGETFAKQKDYAFYEYDNRPAGHYRLEISNVN